MIIITTISSTSNRAGPTICGVTTFSGKSGMQIPSGRTGGRAGVGDINRDGLIFYVDAAYSRIGGKDPIHDLSSFGKMGELRNGASVISDHGGVFLLDGTDDFVLFPPIEEKLTDFTFIVWCYHDSVESGDAPFS